ncbi:uncharacterized protein LOC125946688 isoform X3 [Dermacentor silvarum]|uniref:uncharacterized protein LOC125946688 isoform X3 n=1 Tax=Dermacentor silvarum TaxID=543639 RepID=UPI002101D0FC|nr:uncharacterized protein LOC125946688 isoform X3 [Dermacentor silvarum]
MGYPCASFQNTRKPLQSSSQTCAVQESVEFVDLRSQKKHMPALWSWLLRRECEQVCIMRQVYEQMQHYSCRRGLPLDPREDERDEKTPAKKTRIRNSFEQLVGVIGQSYTGNLTLLYAMIRHLLAA